MKNMFKINGNPQEFADLGVFHKLSKQFLPYAQERLGFDKPVSVNLISDPQNAKNPLGKTAYYNPGTMEVTVFVDKRHVKDILRSMSHELVHHTQNCRGEFEGGVNTGPGYAQEDGHMREMEKEAYLEGQLLLRDFEDNLKKENKMKITETTLKQLIKEQLELMEKMNVLDPKPGEEEAAARANRAMKKRMASRMPDFDAIRAELSANEKKEQAKKAARDAANRMLPDEEVAKLTKPLPGDKDRAVAKPGLDELQLEEDGSVDEGHCPGDRDEVDEGHCPGDRDELEEANAKPDFLDFDGDGNKKEPMKQALADKESLEEDEQNEGLGKKVGTHDGKPVRQIGSKKPADTHPAYDTPQADRARRGKGKLTVQKEDWTKKNKDQLLFERLIEKWIK